MILGFRCIKNYKLFKLLIASLFLLSCTTLSYREVQNDFNDAVQADNVQSVDALGGIVGSSALYEQVLDKLTDDFIKGLDPRLRLNAYVLRAVSEWRTGKLTEAKQTAQTGLSLENVPESPRDKIILYMIPALVNDQDLTSRYLKLSEPEREQWKLDWDTYSDLYKQDCNDAAELLKNAEIQASMASNLPKSMVYYVHLQRWRILNNWRFFINKIWDGSNSNSKESVELREKARDQAANLLGAKLTEEIKRELELVPEDNELRRLMEALSLQ